MQHPPNATPADQQQIQNQHHLRTLAIFWHIMGVLWGLGVLGSLIYMVLGGIIMFSNSGTDENDPALVIGPLFLIVGGVMTLFTLLGSVLHFMVGRGLTSHRRYMLCIVMAAIECLNVPLGTILGIFTFIVLGKPEVKAMFDAVKSDRSSR